MDRSRHKELKLLEHWGKGEMSTEGSRELNFLAARRHFEVRGKGHYDLHRP